MLTRATATNSFDASKRSIELKAFLRMSLPFSLSKQRNSQIYRHPPILNLYPYSQSSDNSFSLENQS